MFAGWYCGTAVNFVERAAVVVLRQSRMTLEVFTRSSDGGDVGRVVQADDPAAAVRSSAGAGEGVWAAQ